MASAFLLLRARVPFLAVAKIVRKEAEICNDGGRIEHTLTSLCGVEALRPEPRTTLSARFFGAVNDFINPDLTFAGDSGSIGTMKKFLAGLGCETLTG